MNFVYFAFFFASVLRDKAKKHVKGALCNIFMSCKQTKNRVLDARNNSLWGADPGSNPTCGPLLHVIPPVSLCPFQHCSRYHKGRKAPKNTLKQKRNSLQELT